MNEKCENSLEEMSTKNRYAMINLPLKRLSADKDERVLLVTKNGREAEGPYSDAPILVPRRCQVIGTQIRDIRRHASGSH